MFTLLASNISTPALSAPGIGGIELVNGSMSRKPSGKREARCANFNSDSVDAKIPLPSQLVYGTAIPARLPILKKN
ncbi:N-6 DNA methylase [Phaeobacter sp. NW0010-22]|uniref:N-6 DNA methylase n=1 Tax=Phaeobacter sp. NW0010-22 TaxID=3135907 RepID=UPI003104333A